MAAPSVLKAVRAMTAEAAMLRADGRGLRALRKGEMQE